MVKSKSARPTLRDWLCRRFAARSESSKEYPPARRPSARFARAEGVGLAEAKGRAAKRSQEPERLATRGAMASRAFMSEFATFANNEAKCRHKCEFPLQPH